MWSSDSEVLENGRTRRFRILLDSETLSFEEVVQHWRTDEAFRTFFSGELARDPHRAFLWETPPVTRDTFDRPFEFVLMESRTLAAMPPDPHSFSEPLKSAENGIATFWNLGGDALLVAPQAEASDDVYAHLAAFVRGAPGSQRHAFWRAVAAALQERLGHEPVWLSTSGLGVAWVHARLDERPKYYNHADYLRHP